MPLGSAPRVTDFQSVRAPHKDHGRLYTHTLTTRARLNPTSDWQYLGQVFQRVRERRVLTDSTPTREVSDGLSRLPKTTDAPPHLLTLRRTHWRIENQLHFCRDVTFHEDASRLMTGHAALAIAILNTLVLGLFRLRGVTSTVSAPRVLEACPMLALTFIVNTFG